jgi:hypothetical protein
MGHSVNHVTSTTYLQGAPYYVRLIISRCTSYTALSFYGSSRPAGRIGAIYGGGGNYCSSYSSSTFAVVKYRSLSVNASSLCGGPMLLAWNRGLLLTDQVKLMEWFIFLNFLYGCEKLNMKYGIRVTSGNACESAWTRIAVEKPSENTTALCTLLAFLRVQLSE